MNYVKLFALLLTSGLISGLGFSQPVSAQSLNEAPFENSDELRLLTGDELVAAFSGKTHYGTYKEFREKTGTSQYSEHTKADGTTLYNEGELTITGRWRAAGDRVCFAYDEEVSGVHCFIIYELGTCLYGYNPSYTSLNGPLNPNYWNAKSIRKGDVSTCDDLLG